MRETMDRTNLFFPKYFIYYFFLERGVGNEKKRERNINVWLPLLQPLMGTWPATYACALTGNQTSNSGLQPRAQSTKAHQPGQKMLIYFF